MNRHFDIFCNILQDFPYSSNKCDKTKNTMSLEHTRHRSPLNFLVHVIACTTAYAVKKILNSNYISYNNHLSLS